MLCQGYSIGKNNTRQYAACCFVAVKVSVCLFCIVTKATVLWIAAAPPCTNRFRWRLAMTNQESKIQQNTAARQKQNSTKLRTW